MTHLERAPCGYIAFGDDQRIRDVNHEAARLLDLDRQRVRGMTISELLAPRTRIFFTMHVYPAVALQGAVREVYASWRKPDGEEVASVMNITRHEAEGDALTECVFLPMRRRRLLEHELIAGRRAARAEQSALAQLKHAQAQLAVQDQLASLGMLAAGVGHEINNPLSYVAGNLELIRARVATIPEHTELLEMLHDASEGVQRIAEIVGDLRTLSRVEAHAKREPVELKSVLDVALRMAGNQLRHSSSVNVELPPEPLTVWGDAARIGQILLNLLVNAAQALPAGRPDNRVLVRAYRDGDNAVLEVEDNGSGIPAEVLGHIFDPFFTTKPTGVGTGLGLSVCNSIVTSLGGSISVRSVVGDGSCFQVSLPLLAAVTMETEATSRDASPVAVEATRAPEGATTPEVRADGAATTARPRVLIIDDDQAVTRLLSRALSDFDVSVVNQSSVALSVLTQHSFDVVLCDLMMPGLSGIDIYTTVSQTHPELAKRFIFMTGGAFSQDAQEFLGSIDNLHLQKPFGASALQTACLKLARSSATGG